MCKLIFMTANENLCYEPMLWLAVENPVVVMTESMHTNTSFVSQHTIQCCRTLAPLTQNMSVEERTEVLDAVDLQFGPNRLRSTGDDHVRATIVFMWQARSGYASNWMR